MHTNDRGQRQRRLLIPVRAGLEVARRYDLGCEAPSAWDDSVVLPCAKRLLTAHAPFAREGRLNIGAIDREHRRFSLQVISEYIKQAVGIPALRTIVVHPCPRLWKETGGREHPLEQVSDYGLFIAGLQELTRRVAGAGLDLVLENNRAYWEDVPGNQPYDPERHDDRIREYFGTSPESWSQVAQDVGAPNFGLCLDTSHSTTYSHRFPEPQRPEILDRYLDLGRDRIWHLHWNGSSLLANEGRDDRHLPVGQDALPVEHHRRIWNWPSVRSWLLEHWVDEKTLVSELAFIRTL